MVEGKVWRNMDDLLKWADALSILPSKRRNSPTGAIAIAALRDVNSPAPARESQVSHVHLMPVEVVFHWLKDEIATCLYK